MNTNPPLLSSVAERALWILPATIAPNNFKFKSLSNWSLNFSVGCAHACRFCYGPSVSTAKLAPKLRAYGVSDPDSEWGEYSVVRPRCEKTFLRSLQKAEELMGTKLKPDGNRAVMLSTTTDPYQVIRHADPQTQRALNAHHRWMVRRALELIRDHSSLNVRILTRSPLARADFSLYRTLGDRLVFGMSLPTLRDDLSKVYEPKAPAPSARLKALRRAKEAGLYTYVAVAPTFPESDPEDLRQTLMAVAALHPITIFSEPINVRAKNVARIAEAGVRHGVALRTDVFSDAESWRQYALEALRTVEQLAEEMGLSQLHLWPDSKLGSAAAFRAVSNPAAYQSWLERWWGRISEWPSGVTLGRREKQPRP